MSDVCPCWNKTIAPYTFIMTCPSCPEQYDMYLDGVIVGYVRLRSGTLRAHTQTDTRNLGSIDWDNPFYYYHWEGDNLKGMFDTHDECQEHLQAIIRAYEAICLPERNQP